MFTLPVGDALIEITTGTSAIVIEYGIVSLGIRELGVVLPGLNHQSLMMAADQPSMAPQIVPVSTI